VAPAAEEIATGITAATDLLFALFPGRQICHLGARGGAACVVTSIVANKAYRVSRFRVLETCVADLAPTDLTSELPTSRKESAIEPLYSNGRVE
jgi:hypothetical protein